MKKFNKLLYLSNLLMIIIPIIIFVVFIVNFNIFLLPLVILGLFICEVLIILLLYPKIGNAAENHISNIINNTTEKSFTYVDAICYFIMNPDNQNRTILYIVKEDDTRNILYC